MTGYEALADFWIRYWKRTHATADTKKEATSQADAPATKAPEPRA